MAYFEYEKISFDLEIGWTEEGQSVCQNTNIATTCNSCPQLLIKTASLEFDPGFTSLLRPSFTMAMTTAPFKESFTRTVKIVKTLKSSPAAPPISRYSIHLGRLLQEEDERIEGCFFFHRRSDQTFHIPGNILRILFKIVTAPLLQWTPHAVAESVLNPKWKVEYADTPAAVLAVTMGKNRPQYSVAGFKPTWILKVLIKDGELFEGTQVPYSEAIEAQHGSELPYAERRPTLR